MHEDVQTVLAMGSGQTLWVVNSESPEQIASLRYMAFLPAQARHEPVARFLPGMSATSVLNQFRPTTLVLTKAFDPSIVALAGAARERSIPIVVVLCDDRTNRPQFHELDAALADLADDIVVQTMAMSEHVRAVFGRECTIIEEPYEMPAGVPRFNPGENLDLLWYGRFTNHDTLGAGILPLVDDPALAFRLTVVTDRVTEHLAALARQIGGREGASIELRRWSLSGQAEALGRADVVIIPSLDRQDKRVKGHNRLVESIRGGVFALAYALPAYQELSEFCWCGSDLHAGLTWALENREAAVDRVRKGQAYIERRFSIGSINARWQELFDSERSMGLRG